MKAESGERESSAQFQSDESDTLTLSFVRRHKDTLFDWTRATCTTVSKGCPSTWQDDD